MCLSYLPGFLFPTGWDSCSQPLGIQFPAVGNPSPDRLETIPGGA